jgi:hypothetical protein
MKKIFILISIILIVVLVTLIMPKTAEAGSVDVSAWANKTTIIDGEEVIIEITIVNNTGSTIFLSNLNVDGLIVDFQGNPIPDGSRYVIGVTKNISFGQNLDYGFSVALRYDGGIYAYSNQINFTLDFAIDPGFAPPPADSRTDFNVSANKTSVSSGDEVAYTIHVKNLGNTDITDYNVTLNGKSIKEFDLLPGAEKIFTYKKSYTSNSLEKFSYGFIYTYNGDSHKINTSNSRDFTITVTSSKSSSNNQSNSANPTPQAINDSSTAGISIIAEPKVNSVEQGQEAIIVLAVVNISDLDLYDVGISDNNGELHGGWPIINKGETKTKELIFVPQSTMPYIFSVITQGSDSNIYEFTSNEVMITVEVSGSVEIIEEPMLIDADNIQNKEEPAPFNLPADYMFYIILIAVVIVLAIVVIALARVFSSRRQN